jgi:hypothetical protein
LIEFIPNLVQLMITFGICVRLHELNIGVLQPSPPLRLQAPRGFTKEVTHASLRREKLWILGTEEFLSLTCSFFLRIMAPLNLIELNRPSPHDSILLT